MKKITVLASVKKPYALKGNLGDIFGYLLMEHYSKDFDISVDRIGVEDEIGENTFAAVGSIIHLCFKKVKGKLEQKSLTILGCGLIKDSPIPDTEKLNFIGVRGPKTKELLTKDTEVISDPGLLISKLFKLPKNPKNEEVGYIIHSVDRKHFFEMFPEEKPNLIDNYASYEEFLDQLSRYKYIVSSSLHGIIFVIRMVYQYVR